MKVKNRNLTKISMILDNEKINVCFKYAIIAQDINPGYRWHTLTPKQAYKLVKRYNALNYVNAPVETTMNGLLWLEWYKFYGKDKT